MLTFLYQSLLLRDLGSSNCYEIWKKYETRFFCVCCKMLANQAYRNPQYFWVVEFSGPSEHENALYLIPETLMVLNSASLFSETKNYLILIFLLAFIYIFFPQQIQEIVIDRWSVSTVMLHSSDNRHLSDEQTLNICRYVADLSFVRSLFIPSPKTNIIDVSINTYVLHCCELFMRFCIHAKETICDWLSVRHSKHSTWPRRKNMTRKQQHMRLQKNRAPFACLQVLWVLPFVLHHLFTSQYGGFCLSSSFFFQSLFFSRPGRFFLDRIYPSTKALGYSRWLLGFSRQIYWVQRT